MGLLVSPDIFQEKMSELMSGLEFAHAYLDDLQIISTEEGFDKHLGKLEWRAEHQGINRTELTIEQHLWWPKMRDHITNYLKICPICQHKKR